MSNKVKTLQDFQREVAEAWQYSSWDQLMGGDPKTFKRFHDNRTQEALNLYIEYREHIALKQGFDQGVDQLQSRITELEIGLKQCQMDRDELQIKLDGLEILTKQLIESFSDRTWFKTDQSIITQIQKILNNGK